MAYIYMTLCESPPACMEAHWALQNVNAEVLGRVKRQTLPKGHHEGVAGPVGSTYGLSW